VAGAGPEQAARQLVDAANERGGRDNMTVALAGLASPGAVDAVADDRTRKRMDVLRQVDLFQSCTYRQLLEFTQQAREVEARPGQELFEDGAPGEDFYVIVSGRVSIEKQGTVLAELGPGHYFGELVLVDRPVRSATARALTPARFLVVGREGFQRVIKQDGALGTAVLWQMLRKLAQHLRSTNERLVHETITLEELDPLEVPRG
jgi:CRP-like cAMP-binding protein